MAGGADATDAKPFYFSRCKEGEKGWGGKACSLLDRDDALQHHEGGLPAGQQC